MKIKVISDGTVHGTKVVNAETGEALEYVVSVEWEASVRHGNYETHATIELMRVPVEIVAETHVKHVLRENM